MSSPALNTEHRTLNTSQIAQAIELAREIKALEADNSAAACERIREEAELASEAILAPVAEQMERLRGQIMALAAPYAEQLAAIEDKRADDELAVHTKARERAAEIKTKREELATLLADLRPSEEAQQVFKGSLILTEKRTLSIADNARAVETIQKHFPAGLTKYLEPTDAAIEIVYAMAKAGKGDAEEINAELAAQFPGFVLSVVFSPRINRIPELQATAADSEQETEVSGRESPEKAAAASSLVCDHCKSAPATGIDRAFEVPCCDYCANGAKLDPLPSTLNTQHSTLPPQEASVA